MALQKGILQHVLRNVVNKTLTVCLRWVSCRTCKTTSCLVCVSVTWNAFKAALSSSGEEEESCYFGSRWSLNKWVLSLLRKMASGSGVLTLVGRSFHRWGAGAGKSCDSAEGPLSSLSDGGTSRPADAVERSGRAGVCGLTSVWRECLVNWNTNSEL